MCLGDCSFCPMPRGGYAAMKQIHNPGFLRVAIIGLWVGAALLFFSAAVPTAHAFIRSEEHTSELQSLMRISYAVFCLKKKKNNKKHIKDKHIQYKLIYDTT